MEAALNTPAGRFPLGSAIIKIGSAPDNQLVLQDPKASPLHAGIRPEAQGYSLTDLGSASGTFINGRRLDFNAPRLLAPGDTIRIGDTFFTYEVSGAATPLVAANAASNTAQLNNPGIPPAANAGGSRPAPTDAPVPPTTYAGESNRAPTDAAAYAPYTTYTTGESGTQQAYSGAPYGGQSSYAPSAYDPFASSAAPASLSLASLFQQQNRRDLWISLGVLAVVLIIGLLVFNAIHSPQRTLDTFCNALQSADYQTAYNQLSPGLQQEIGSEARFAGSYGSSRVLACTYTNVNVSGNYATATVSITSSGSASSPETEVYVLSPDSSFNWKIDGLKSSNQ